MKFFLDFANLSELKAAAEFGIIDGVTTNPSLIAKKAFRWKRGSQNLRHHRRRHQRRSPSHYFEGDDHRGPPPLPRSQEHRGEGADDRRRH